MQAHFCCAHRCSAVWVWTPQVQNSWPHGDCSCQIARPALAAVGMLARRCVYAAVRMLLEADAALHLCKITGVADAKLRNRKCCNLGMCGNGSTCSTMCRL